MNTLRTAAEQELGVRLPRSPRDGPVGRLVKQGEIAFYPGKERIPGVTHGNGTHSVLRATSVDDLHLGTLLEFAESRIRPDSEVPTKRGRTGLNLQARNARAINEKQFQRMRTMARHVGYFCNPRAETERKALSAVRGVALMWDPADGLEGDWREMLKLIDASKPKPSQLSEYKSAARALLDLAAVHGFLLRQPIARSFVIPTTWIPHQERWCEVARQPGIAAVLAVNIILGAIAEVCGSDVDPDSLNLDQTGRVVAHIQDLLLADQSLATGHRTSVRRTLRHLMKERILPSVDVNSWDYRQRHRMAAWSNTLSKKIAAQMGADQRGQGLGLIGDEASPRLGDLDGYAPWKEFPFPVLADPDHPYSLARVIDFHTAGGLERAGRGFRALGNFPREAPRRALTGRDASLWNMATTKTALSLFANYMGWVQKFRPEVDLRQATMLDLLQPELLNFYVAAVSDGQWSTPNTAQRVLVYLGLAASPCLEAEALKSNNVADANLFFAASALATGRGTDIGHSWNGVNLHGSLEIASTRDSGLLDVDNDDVFEDESNSADFDHRIDIQRARAEALEAGYREVLGVEYAFDGMVLIYEAAKMEVLRQFGIESLVDFRNRWGSLRISRSSLRKLRALSLWNLHLAAPIRSRAAVHLNVSMAQMVGSTLRLKVPRRLMKVPKNGDYKVDLWTQGEEGFDIEMYLLYLDLVRPALLAPSRRETITNANSRRAGKYLWVNDWGCGRTTRDQVLPATLNKMLRDVVELGAAGLGLDQSKEARLLSLAQVHHFRHAVACKLVRCELAERAAMLLHHKGTDTLREVYAARSVAESTGSIRAALMASVKKQNTVETELRELLDNATPEQVEEIRRIVGK